ncbi:TIGR04222 domain-containing membrane protein [Novosphingobium sp. KACC 22771]|uniref:TIGR04222 domain-containing membrane protein n=1 Tax=Novosphingobium sp. KACC 22771 TaxID=3025670 RepID=UPI002365F6D5|nr:TIGR04222 domain-containing membrane protein [Novosphingobium sp. KACC 22771]WDF73874.1 TIGR04222 domain-containing membrane protein [Novosphingobium sp. KACC 22771]
MAGLDPFQLSNGQFLAAYAALLLAAAGMAWVLPHWLRPDGKMLSLQHPFEMACLSGGPTRYAETLVLGLMQAGHLRLNDDRFFEPLRPTAGISRAEVAVLGLPAGTDWDLLMTSLWSSVHWVELRLIARGLWLDRAQWWQIRGWACLPLVLVLLFGAIRWEAGVLRHAAVPYLGWLVLAALLGAVVRCVTVDRRTQGGCRVLARARDEARSLRHRYDLGQAQMAVALFGTEVLAATPYEALYRLRHRG